MIYIKTDENGLIISAASGNGDMSEYTPVDTSIGVAQLLSYQYDGTELTPRPVVTKPTFEGGVLSIGPLPLGTQVTLLDRSNWEAILDTLTETEDWSEQFTLPDAGLYVVELTPPAPYLPNELEFEVT